jgi:hypothetical protein
MFITLSENQADELAAQKTVVHTIVGQPETLADSEI